jgi:hypothetical protein
MILIHINKGAWSLKLPNGYEVRGREETSGEALCKAAALATRLEALIRRHS